MGTRDKYNELLFLGNEFYIKKLIRIEEYGWEPEMGDFLVQSFFKVISGAPSRLIRR